MDNNYQSANFGLIGHEHRLLLQNARSPENRSFRGKGHENRNSQSIINDQSIRERSSFPQAIEIRTARPQSRSLPPKGSQRSSPLFRRQIPYRIWTFKKTSHLLMVILVSQPSEFSPVSKRNKAILVHCIRGVRTWCTPTLPVPSLNFGRGV